MPSRRRAFWIALAVSVPLGLLSGCRPSRTALLSAPPAVDVTGRPGEGAGTRVDCAAGRPWLARLEPHDFDARLELRDAAGRELAAVAVPAMAAGREYLYGESAPGGAAQLRVVAAGSAGTAASYRLEVFCLTPAPTADVTAALQAMNVASDPARATDAVRRDAAVARFREAEDTWKRLGESRLEADVALQLAALHYYERQDWAPALAAARRAARSAQAGADPWARAHARLIEGAASLELANAGQASAGAGASGAATAGDSWSAAEAAFNEALELYRAADAPLSAGRVLNLLAGVQYARGDFDAATTGYEATVAALRTARAAGEEATVASNLAVLRYDRGDYSGAARDFERILEQPPRAPTARRAAILQNFAAASMVIGQTERALTAYRESLDIANQLDNEDLLARSLAGLGVNHSRLGHRDLAITYLQDAVALRRRQGRAEPLAQALAQLGDVFQQQRDLERASAAHREAVEAIGPTAAPALRARLLLAVGDDQAAAGRLAAAVDTYTRALRLLAAHQRGLVPRLLIGRARSRRLLGQLDLAQADAGQAAALARDNDDRETLIAALIEDSRLATARDDPAAALHAADSAVAEVQRLPVGTANPDNRLTLRTRLRAAYELRVQLLAQDAQRARARGDVAGSRSRALEALRATIGAEPGPRVANSASPASRAGADPLDETYTRLAARRYRLEALAERNAEPGPTMRALEREVALLRTRLATGAAPAASGRATGSPPATPPPPRARVEVGSAAVARAATAPPGTVAIAYWLGDEQSWAWTVTPEGIELHALPSRAVVDAAVTRLLAQVRSLGAGRSALDAAATALERLVLPAAMQGAAARNWRVVPDGSLGSVPWALLASRRRIESASLFPSVAALLDAPRGDSAPRREHALRVALFGDPVFGWQDARAPGPASVDAASRGAVAKRRTESDPREFARLPGTAREVAAIAGLAGEGVFLEATGLRATRAAFLQLPADRIDVLHVATHATIDPEVPELAALVLSRLDAAGRSLPGNVLAHDILGMRAAPALVVLSACDAAAEPASAAEGRMNLVRAFLASGSGHVVASLWEASDAATVEFMTRFYESLLQQRLDPETALLRAQRELAASERWRAPFYWAGFVIMQAAP